MSQPMRALAHFQSAPDTAEGQLSFMHAIDLLIEESQRHAGCLSLEQVAPRDLEAILGLARERKLLARVQDATDPLGCVVLYQITRALPHGPERDQLQAFLHDVLRTGPGRSCVWLLAAMVVRERRVPDMEGLLTRVGLCLAHDTLDQGMQRLALSVLAVSELRHAWLEQPAGGTLPQRMLAARLLAAAARGAATRALGGDRAGLSLMTSPAQYALRQRLLFDREPLVWRHAALARGWLSGCSAHEAARVEADLSPNLSPTEWRRAGVSLVASAGISPRGVVKRIARMHEEGVFEKDRGLAAVMLGGLYGVAPQALKPIAERLVGLAGVGAGPELLALLERDRVAPEPLCPSVERVLEATAKKTQDGSLRAHQRKLDARRLAQFLEGENGDSDGVHGSVRHALSQYWSQGARSCQPAASQALTRADHAVEGLRRADTHSASGRQIAFDAVRELQEGVLSEGTLTGLLSLLDEEPRRRAALGFFQERLTNVLLVWPQDSANHQAIDLRRERAIAAIRVLDMDSFAARSRLGSDARVRALQVLLGKLRDPSNLTLSRPLCAAIARAGDALVRAGQWEISDVLLVAATQVPDVGACRIMAEASMLPEVAQCLRALSSCLAPEHDTVPALRQNLDRLLESLPAIAGPRVEALRSSLRALADVAWAELQPKDVPTRLRSGLEGLMGLACSVEVRLTGETGGGRIQGAADLSQVWERLDGGTEAPLAEIHAHLGEAFAGPLGEWLQHLVPSVLRNLHDGEGHASHQQRTEGLPDWLSATREIGDYVVVRCVGGGAGGSVFLTRRREHQMQAGAPLYALKVPDMGSGTTRLNRGQFLELFCAEAGALASLPKHPNLASLESFDRSAFPMPFLVMEHVDGPNLEQELSTKSMAMQRRVDALLGVARGLAVMHAHGIGHLDVKPSNVILSRRGDREEAVLVDFGLAGRCVRAGCGTHAFAAPEVFGPDADQADPCRADIYSLAVMAFEVITGTPLFPGPSELAYIAQHASHDGEPDGIEALDETPELRPWGSLLRAMLRRDPKGRCGIDTVIDVLEGLRRPAGNLPPLPRSDRPYEKAS